MSIFTDSFEPYKIACLRNGVRLPEFQPTEEQYKRVGLPNTASNLEFLTQLCRIGFREKIIPKIPKEQHKAYGDRIKEELALISELGFTGYILMVWDICDFCDQNDIPRGPGRGSVSSSIVCFICGQGITQVDSIKYGTLITRFLSKARAKYKIIEGIKYMEGSLCPDIDIDICYFRRGEVHKYLSDKYKGRTASLLTIQLLKPRILLKDVLKVYGDYSDSDAKEVTDLIRVSQGNAEELDDASSDDGDLENPALKKWIDSNPKNKEYIDLARQISFLELTESKHASALLISNDPIDEVMPLQLDKKTGGIINGFDMQTAQEISLKFDLLGLKNCSVIHECCKMVKINPNEIDIDDPCIYEFFQNPKHLYGIFQFESDAQGGIAKKVKPKNFKQVVDSLSVSRPGASSNLGQYLEYIHHGIYKPIHPVVDGVLKETGGICLFQESYLKLLINAGLMPDDAEIARKALSKKKKELIPDILRKIQAACDKNGHPKEVADLLIKIAEESAGYQFALAHALSYAMISVRTVYLKVKYPIEFLVACLNMAINDSPKKRKEAVQRISEECNQRGIKILPPDISRSEMKYTIENGCIRSGISAVKGLGAEAVKKVVKFKEINGNKFDLLMYLENEGISVGVAQALILSGCFDSKLCGATRNKLLLEYEIFKKLRKEKIQICALGEKYNWDLMKIIRACAEELKTEKGKFIIVESRRNTLRRDCTIFIEKHRRNEMFADLTYWVLEKTLTGMAFSNSLKTIYGRSVDGLISIKEAQESNLNKFMIACQIQKLELRTSRAKKVNYIGLVLSDDSSSCKSMVWGDDNINALNRMNGRELKEGDILVAHLSRKEKTSDLYWADMLVLQECPVVIKKSEIHLEEEKDEDEEKA